MTSDLADLPWSLCLLQFERNLLSHLLLYYDHVVLHHSNNNVFGCFHVSFRTLKALVSELDYIARSYVHLSNYKRCEAMQKLSAHQLTGYYQTQWVSFNNWTASVKRYLRRNLAPIKILQNFWLNMIHVYMVKIYQLIFNRGCKSEN